MEQQPKSVKKLVIEHEGKELVFFAPGCFSNENFFDTVRYIKFGPDRNWTRPLRDKPYTVTQLVEVTKAQNKSNDHLSSEMKYVVFSDKSKKRELMFIFPKSVNHDSMAELIMHMLLGQEDIKFNPDYPPVGAGFVSDSAWCHGRSETLDVGCRIHDDRLLMHSLDYTQPEI